MYPIVNTVLLIWLWYIHYLRRLESTSVCLLATVWSLHRWLDNQWRQSWIHIIFAMGFFLLFIEWLMMIECYLSSMCSCLWCLLVHNRYCRHLILHNFTCHRHLYILNGSQSIWRIDFLWSIGSNVSDNLLSSSIDHFVLT
jgi:hypothetical protein